MKNNIIIFFTSLIMFSVDAQIDSLKISDIESKLLQRIELQESTFNEKVSGIKAFQKKQFETVLSQLLKIDEKLKNNRSVVDSLIQNLILSEKTIEQLKNSISNLENQLNDKVDGLQDKTSQLGDVTTTLAEDLTSAKNEVSEIVESSSKNTNSIDTVNQSLSQKQQYGLIFIAVFLILVLTVYIILSKQQNTSTKAIAAKQQEIFEKQIQDSQQLTDWLSNQTTKNFGNSSDGEVDHSFAKRVADEIVRILTNLSRMDDKIKGYKQLSASVRKLEQSLNSNGYELENLLNKPYDNGMNLQANFVIDENLKEGESIITRVIKPQINYKGKLIQAAQVEVSQGE